MRKAHQNLVQDLYLLAIGENFASVKSQGKRDIYGPYPKTAISEAEDNRVGAARGTMPANARSHCAPELACLACKLGCFLKGESKLTAFLLFPFSLCHLIRAFHPNLLLLLCVISNLAFTKVLLPVFSCLHREPCSYETFGLRSYQYELS